MIRLRQTNGADAGRVYEFAQDLIRIGRMPDSDVAFDPETDLDASGRHAEVRGEEGQWTLIDAGSRNGTWLNGERVKHAALKQGDEIEFGKGGPRVLIEEISERAVDRATERLSVSDAPVAKRAPVPPTEVPGPADSVDASTQPPGSGLGLGQYDVTDPMGKPVFDYPDVDISYTGESSIDTVAQATDTLRAAAAQPVLRYWLVAAALIVVAVTSVFFVVRERRAGALLTPTRVVALIDGARDSLWSVQQTGPNERPVTLCLAFAVRSHLVATTAECVLSIQRAQRQGAEVELFNDGPSKLKVVRLWRHPSASAGAGGADVGLIEVDQALEATLALATPAALSALRNKSEVLSFTAIDRATATSVHTVRSIDPADPRTGAVVEHGASAPSGSPLLDESGHVVAVQSVGGRAVRADLLRALIAGLDGPTE